MAAESGVIKFRDDQEIRIGIAELKEIQETYILELMFDYCEAL